MKWELIQRVLEIILFIFTIDDLISDSPEDRQQLQEIEANIQNLETRTAKLEEIFQPQKANT
ncbi:MAG TPA: hypothetical protein VK184_10925 [Nostocaceae cyanobacterium]|nr:hypothetical protein [Nostocaceae cyanobacterium]